MKRWMLQVLRLVITLILMGAMAFMIVSQREQLEVATTEVQVARAQIKAQQIQIDLLTQKVQDLVRANGAGVAVQQEAK